jgi:hypothetical protein
MIGALVVAASAGAARGGTLIRADFDTANPTFPYAYAGNFAASTQAVTDGAGVAASRAYQMVVNATSADPTLYTFGAGVVQTSPFAGLTRPGALSDLTYSAAVSLGGARSGVTSTPVTLQLQFRVPDGPDVDIDQDVALILEVTRTATADGAFHVISGDLGGARVVQGSLAGLQSAIDAGQLRTVQLNFDVANGVSDFGRDDGNTLKLDDVVVSTGPVPEPGAVGVAAVVLGWGLGRRGRRAAGVQAARR